MDQPIYNGDYVISEAMTLQVSSSNYASTEENVTTEHSLNVLNDKTSLYIGR
jgi:hypothetical protein